MAGEGGEFVFACSFLQLISVLFLLDYSVHSAELSKFLSGSKKLFLK